jgi:hypothetical protein
MRPKSPSGLLLVGAMLPTMWESRALVVSDMVSQLHRQRASRNEQTSVLQACRSNKKQSRRIANGIEGLWASQASLGEWGQAGFAAEESEEEEGQQQSGTASAKMDSQTYPAEDMMDGCEARIGQWDCA